MTVFPDYAVMSKTAGENFTVASRLLPRVLRDHLLALYGFARLVDDIGDEATADRLALLDRIAADVEGIYEGRDPQHPLLRRLATTVHSCALPPEPLLALIEANRVDQRQTSYESFDDLRAYCALSANPVGRLVLHVLRAATPERLRLADDVCTALQLTDHWQDVAEDYARGRVYLPRQDLRSFGCTPANLAAPRAGPRLRELIAFEVRRTRKLLDSGPPLVRTLRGRPALALAGFVAGGRAALAAIEGVGHDVLGTAPRATPRARLKALTATLGDASRSRAA